MPRKNIDDLDKGSRDKTRGLLTQANQILFSALEEVSKLQETHPHDVSYRRIDAHLGMAMNSLELARILMRKRKRSEVKGLVEVQSGAGAGPAKAPIGDNQ